MLTASYNVLSNSCDLKDVISWEPFKLVWSQFDSLTYINMQSNMILQEYRHRKSLS